MPHVVLQGPTTPEDIWRAFEPLAIHETGSHYKALECLLSSDKSMLLVRSLAVERGYSQNFFVKVQRKGDELSLSLEQLARPELTDSLKRLLGLFAWRLMQAEPALTIARTNIPSHIGPPKT